MNDKANGEDEWICPLCEGFNTTNINKCKICLSWRCISCFKYNPINVGKCKTCHQPKQSLGVKKNKKKKRKHKRNKPSSDDNIKINDSQIKYKASHIESNIKLAISNIKINKPKPKPKASYPINIPIYNKSPAKSVFKSNVRPYQSKNKQNTYSHASKPVRVALRNQNTLKTDENLSHRYTHNYKSHSLSSPSMSPPQPTYQSSTSNNAFGFPYRNNNTKSVSPSHSQLSPQSHQSHQSHQKRNIRVSPEQKQNNNVNEYLPRSHNNVKRLLMFGYTMENIQRAWDMMKQQNKHKSIVCDHDGIFIETMLDYLSKIPSGSQQGKRREDRNKIKERRQRSKYGAGEEVYFKCKRVVVIQVDERVNDVLYRVRFLDSGKEEIAKEMYLNRKSDYYHYYEQIGISQKRNNVFMNGKYDNDRDDTFYGPVRDQF